MGLFDTPNAALAALESRVAALEAGTVTPPVDPPVDPPEPFDLAAALDACPSGGTVTIPPGVYTLTAPIVPKPGMTISGYGATLSMPTPGSNLNMVEAHSVPDVSILGLRFTTPLLPRASRRVSGIEAIRCNGWTLTDLTVENMRFGVRWPSDETGYSTGWTVNGLDAIDCLIPLMIADLRNSAFADLTLDGTPTDTGDHCIYLERDCHYLTFDRTVLTRGGGYCLQLHNESDEAHQTDNLTFTNVSMDATGGRICMVLDYNYAYVTLSNLTFVQKDGWEAIRWNGGNDHIVVDGFTATGGGSGTNLMLEGDGTGASTNCELKNGTYTCNGVGTHTGVTVTNVVKV